MMQLSDFLMFPNPNELTTLSIVVSLAQMLAVYFAARGLVIAVLNMIKRRITRKVTAEKRGVKHRDYHFLKTVRNMLITINVAFVAGMFAFGSRINITTFNPIFKIVFVLIIVMALVDIIYLIITRHN